MTFKRITCILAVAALALSGAAVWAVGETTITTKTRTIAAFKNGTGFFLREGEAKLSDGWAVSDFLPPAALGTFWVGSPKPGVSIERLVAGEEEVSKTVPAVSIAEMLAANVGRDVALTVGDKVITGKLLSVPEDRKPIADPAQRGYAPTPPPAIVLVEDNQHFGTFAVSKATITWVEFLGKEKVKPDTVLKEKAKRLRFKVSGAKDKAPVTIGYLQKGISWSPAYMVELIDDKKARLTMQGLLVDDVEDIDGADVFFVVGYPNFIMSDIVSPLALTQSLTDFVNVLGRPAAAPGSYGGYGGSMSQGAMMRQSFSYASDSFGNAPPDFGYSAGKETPGAQEEDLFLYSMKNVSLKKGERAYYTVFSAEVPFEHFYEWTVPDTANIRADGYVNQNRQQETIPPEDQVWHKLKLTNASKYPWTTAPALATSNGQPLAQDMLSYTSKGGAGDLKITVATDIKAKKSESEKMRENDVKLGSDYPKFTKITAEGKLTLKNYKTKPVTVKVKKTLTGQVISASLDGKIDRSTEVLAAVNPTSVITWDLPLKAGEEKSVNYSYYTYVRY